jgi:hypothetical protein
MSGSTTPATTVYEIPLIPATPQSIVITLAGTTYTLVVKWNTVLNYWVLDIYDQTGTIPILTGTPLVTGADLLEQYGYLNFGGQLECQTDFDLTAPPTWGNLGDTGHLFFLVSA